MKKSEILAMTVMLSEKDIAARMTCLSDWVKQFDFLEKQFADIIPALDDEQ